MRLDRERERVESVAVAAAVRAGNAARRAAFQAFRDGRNPARATADALAPMVDVVAGTLLEAHGRGSLVTIERAQQAIRDRGRVRLSRTPLDGAVAFLRRQAQATDAEIDGLRSVYGAEAFDTAGRFSRMVQRQISNTVAELVADGASVREGVRRLGGVFSAAGLAPDRPFALESIVRTESAKAFAAGRWNALQDNPIAFDLLWGFRYETVGDDRVRLNHAALQGAELPKDDPFWLTAFPPNGYNCRCQAVELFVAPSRTTRPGNVLVDDEVVRPIPDPGFSANFGEVFRGPPIGQRAAPMQPPRGPTVTAPPPLLPRVAAPGPVGVSPAGAGAATRTTTPTPATPASNQPAATAPQIQIARNPRQGIEVDATGQILTSVQSAIRIESRGRIRSAAMDAMSAAESVHRIPNTVPAIPLLTSRAKRNNGVFRSNLGRPVQIQISSRGPHPGLTTAHELGHALDLAAIGPARRFATAIPGGPLTDVISVIRQTDRFAELTQLAATRGISVRLRRYYLYLLQPDELWARAYAQLVAQQGASTTLRRELRSVQNRPEPYNAWTTADFAPVAAAINRTFRELGWTPTN